MNMVMYMVLDKYQEEIANDFEGKIAVVAGPGSGKTRTLIERTERIYNTGKKPQSILLISYTNKVRSEIKKRLREKKEELEMVNVHTFHSFGVYLLRMHGSLIGINRNFEIIDDEDAKSILNKIYTELNIIKSDFPIKKTLKEMSKIYSKYREQFENSNEFVKFLSEQKNDKGENKNLFDIIFSYYTHYKRSNNYLDFDDILTYTNALLYKEDAKKVVQSIEYVMVDEAQDLDTTQYELIQKLEENGINNILLVGDFDQNIYSWRGARTDLFKEFYQKAKKYSLGINYRSTPQIVQYSRKLIEHNKDRIEIDLVSNIQNSQYKPICNYFDNGLDELKWVANSIKSLLDKNIPPSEIAILYRANYLSRGIEGELIKSNIKYVIYNGFEFYQRKEIKDCISLLKLLINKKEKIALERILLNLPNIGPKKVEYVLNNELDKLSDNDKKVINNMYKILDDTKGMKLIASKLKYMIEKLEYIPLWDDGNLEDRMENYSELLRFIETFDDELIGLQDFLDNISLLNKRDERTNIGECIKLMTLHSSKGLEFRYVYIINALDGIIPNERSINEDLLNEERRLMYVGITRAKEQVYITASPFYGYSNSYFDISRFVKEAGINVNNFASSNYINNNEYIQYNINSNIRPSNRVNKSKDNVVVELILAIFLGWLGVHCFYKGNTTKGIIYLFTFGLFGIGWFIDIIILLVDLIKKM